MKKVGILTLSCYNSLGNQLQNYALLETLKALGCQADTIFISEGAGIEKIQKLQEFSDRYISKVVVDFTNTEEVRKLNDLYDAFIVGSDQVWNCKFSYVQKYIDAFFLEFAAPEKRLSYAASFGISKCPNQYQVPCIQGLSGMAAISVREQEGAEIVWQLCGLKAQVHVDPTLLLNAADYKKLERPSSLFPDSPFVVCNFLFPYTQEQTQEILDFCGEHKLAVVDVDSLLWEDKIGVEEFLYAMSHAEYVFTDSFHCTVFAIQFRKPFLVYTCNINSGVASRINHLLKILNMTYCAYQGEVSFADIQTDFNEVGQILARERVRSCRYLKEILGLPLDDQAEVVAHKEQCCGCGACAAVCPKQCITMQPDNEGFLYPQIDPESCIHCSRCQEVCPSLHPGKVKRTPEAYCVVNRNEAVRRQSSSGGLFTALAEQIILQKGVVFGAAFGEHLKVRHQYTETVEGLAAFRNSKYVQSDLGDSYRQTKAFLQQGRKVLFSGTPCQIQGLCSFLGKDFPNLLTVDMICHGVPSPLAWDRYVSYREAVHNQKAVYASFRSKKLGWRNPGMEFLYADGTFTEWDSFEDPYYLDFLKNSSLRRSCFQCPFKACHHSSDLTMADFWGVESLLSDMDDNKGTSLLLVNSEKGAQYLTAVRNQLNMKQVDMEQAVIRNPCFLEPVKQPAERAMYFERLKEGDLYV